VWADRDGKFGGCGSISYESTLEGGPDLRGVNKPVGFGDCKGVAAPLVDFFHLIHQYSDPAVGGTLNADDVMAGGEVLVEGALNDYTSDDTDNIFTLDAAHNHPITIDFRGVKDGAGDHLQRTADILAFILEDIAGLAAAEIDTAGTFSTFNDEYPYRIGLYLDTQPHTTAEVMDTLMQHRAFWSHGLDGKISIHLVKNLDGVTPDLTLGVDDIVAGSLQRESTAPVTFKQRLAFQRIWSPISEFVGVVTPDEQQRQSREFRFITSSDESLKDVHAAARNIIRYSLIHLKRDAETEASIALDLLRAPKDIYTLGVTKHLFQYDPGMVIELTAHRFGLDSPKNFLCVGDSINPNGVASELAGVKLWGPFDPEP
jgi:hypothetical protein